MKAAYYEVPLQPGEVDEPVDFVAMARAADMWEEKRGPLPTEPAQVNLFTRELERVDQWTWEEAVARGQF